MGRGLTEDMDAMSPDQADGLVRLVTPHVSAELSEALRRAVQARGVESLTSAEALVWAFVCVPNGTVWADLVSQRFDVEAKAASVSGGALERCWSHCTAKAQSVHYPRAPC